MTRTLKTSGFLGLATMMVVGLYQNMLQATGEAVPGWMIGGHAHLGVLSILAIVVGFAVESLEIVGRLRATVTALYTVGQWLLPVTLWIGVGFDMEFLMPTITIWGLCLIGAMLIMAWQTVSTEPTTARPTPDVAADD